MLYLSCYLLAHTQAMWEDFSFPHMAWVQSNSSVSQQGSHNSHSAHPTTLWVSPLVVVPQAILPSSSITIIPEGGKLTVTLHTCIKTQPCSQTSPQLLSHTFLIHYATRKACEEPWNTTELTDSVMVGMINYWSWKPRVSKTLQPHSQTIPGLIPRPFCRIKS